MLHVPKHKLLSTIISSKSKQIIGNMKYTNNNSHKPITKCAGAYGFLRIYMYINM